MNKSPIGNTPDISPALTANFVEPKRPAKLIHNNTRLTSAQQKYKCMKVEEKF